MSPVKWRFRSSIGTTCVMPPPAAPPLMPNTGPSDGSRRQGTGFFPIAPSPRGRPEAGAGLLADRAEPLGQPDERRRLALARLRRRHARDADDLAVRPAREAVEHAGGDLRLVAAVRLDLVGLEPDVLGDLVDRDELGFLRDLQA